jgi:hypothetical protein
VENGSVDGGVLAIIHGLGLAVGGPGRSGVGSTAFERQAFLY